MMPQVLACFTILLEFLIDITYFSKSDFRI